MPLPVMDCCGGRRGIHGMMPGLSLFPVSRDEGSATAVTADLDAPTVASDGIRFMIRASRMKTQHIVDAYLRLPGIHFRSYLSSGGRWIPGEQSGQDTHHRTGEKIFELLHFTYPFHCRTAPNRQRGSDFPAPGPEFAVGVDVLPIRAHTSV